MYENLRRKMARSTAQTHLKIERQRKDFHFKTAKRYADAYSTIVVEDLNLRGLARSRLAKSILDAAWGAFLFILTYKAGSAGGQVVRINPRYATQQCSKCGELVQKSLSVRTHSCPGCGYVADRDVNAAQNILRAGTRPSGTLADGLADEPRSRRLMNFKDYIGYFQTRRVGGGTAADPRATVARRPAGFKGAIYPINFLIFISRAELSHYSSPLKEPVAIRE